MTAILSNEDFKKHGFSLREGSEYRKDIGETQAVMALYQKEHNLISFSYLFFETTEDKLQNKILDSERIIFDFKILEKNDLDFLLKRIKSC